jgi:hypothetical protein
VRFVLLLALAAGCYAPSVTPGAPCDPAVGNCPRPLMCVPDTAGFTCQRGPGNHVDDAAIDSAADAEPDAAIDAMVDAMADAPIDAPPVMHVEYPSVVADCVDPTSPDPDQCIQVNGTGQLAVDADDSSSNNPWIGFVRFDLDAVLAGRVVTSVKLRMSTTSSSSSVSDSSGAVWQVQMFTRTSLATALPLRVGTMPIAPSQGSVDPNEDVLWTLPTSLVSANASVYLSIVSTSTDGTNYWNQTGTRPPRLMIDLQ